MSIKTELMQLRREFGALQTANCSAEENEAYRKLLRQKKSLPNGVYQRSEKLNINDAELYANVTFVKLCKSDITDEELQEYFTYKKLAYLKTIKQCVVFFTALTVISLIVGLLLALSIL